jgi:hypothetical protein
LSDLDRLFKLIDLMADPAAARRRAQEYVDRCGKAKSEAEAAVAERKRTLAEHQKHREEHAARIEAALADFDQKCKQREADVQQRDQYTRTLNNQAAADAAAAAQLRSAYEAKMKLFKQAESLPILEWIKMLPGRHFSAQNIRG